jgi:threonine synthase
LLEEQIISPSDRVVCILTGHQLKDPDATVDYHRGSCDDTGTGAYANPPVRCAAEIEAIVNLLDA